MNQLRMLSAVRIATDRVLLRKARDTDREWLIELRTDPEVGAYIGGPLPRKGVEQYLERIGGAANATITPGTFIIADKATDALIGIFELKRRPADWPGHVIEDGEELELGYLMRPDTWGAGLAFEAATAVLRAAADELPDQPVLIATQTANQRSLRLAARLGFRPVSTFEWFDAEQTLCLASLHSFKA
ncbi:GNAT family N-acetyltransferase [Nocardia sp. SYP-A9097]|uniref:GNAT family N-acetyltransferase n=1 Tax=Nocardia sp. SYP-A9097 TaxID=2663237 RepID=UPI00129A1B88|nr:GNAT family N-acetyltransferase [Nocardia sp. SYP-A9097]MRH87647.1 GNAT family N-acetyltransferase [Nocardia sp. SYP-A9097]